MERLGRPAQNRGPSRKSLRRVPHSTRLTPTTRLSRTARIASGSNARALVIAIRRWAGSTARISRARRRPGAARWPSGRRPFLPCGLDPGERPAVESLQCLMSNGHASLRTGQSRRGPGRRASAAFSAVPAKVHNSAWPSDVITQGRPSVASPSCSMPIRRCGSPRVWRVRRRLPRRGSERFASPAISPQMKWSVPRHRSPLPASVSSTQAQRVRGVLGGIGPAHVDGNRRGPRITPPSPPSPSATWSLESAR